MTSAEHIFHNTTLKSATGSAVEASSPSVRLNVADVSAQFSLEFYNTMSRQPDHLHGFYGKQSQMVHSVEGDLEAPICTTLEAIHSRIMAMGYQGARIIVESIDAQASLNGGIFILTTGNMKLNTGVMKKFVQSFFLAEQPNGYYVLNDCFRFIENVTASTPVSPAAPLAAATQTQTSAPKAAPVATEAKPQKPVEPVKETPVPQQASPVKEKKVEPVKETVEKPKAQPAKKPVEAPVAAPAAAPSTPSSWASLAAGGSNMWKDGVVAASKGPVASETLKEPRRNEQTTRTFSTKSATGEQRRENTRRPEGRAEGRSEVRTEGRGDAAPRSPRPESAKQDYSRSVFVRNLGSNPDSAALRKVLEASGTITSFDFNAVKGQAFVEFETAQMAISAVAAKYQFNGVALNVEGRRPASQRPGYNRGPRQANAQREQ